MYMSGLSVCVLTFNHYAASERALRTLLLTEFPCQTEILLVDNGSSDGTQAELLKFAQRTKAHGLDVRVLFNESNCGCAGGRNIAASLASGEWLVFLDNDVEICDRWWLQEALRFAAGESEVGIVGGKLTFGHRPDRLQSAGIFVDQNAGVHLVGAEGDPNLACYNVAREVQAVLGACLVIRKQLFAELGGFDEIYNPGNYEDVDLCFKVRQGGLKVMYNPKVAMRHWAHTTSRGTPGLGIQHANVRNQAVFRRRWATMLKVEAALQSSGGWHLGKVSPQETGVG